MSKPISISLAASRPPATTKQPLSKKRPAANLDSDSDDDDNNHREKVHVITAFDAARGGAVGEKQEEEKGPLIIAAMKNRDWRAEAERRRGKGSVWLPPEAFAGRSEGEGAIEVDTGAGVHYGLQVFQRRTEDNQPSPPPPPPPGEVGEEPVKAKTEEEQALAALLSDSSKPPSTTLILPSSAGNTDWRDRDELQAYKADVATRPDVPTLDDYAAVPVEEFGAALLRGMGWREGTELGGRGGVAKQSKLRVVEKRPAFLGIGAKAKEEVPELGTWGKADKSGRKRGGGKRVDTTYVPVVLIDRKTGKVVNESEVVENGKGTGGGGGTDRDHRNGRDRERTRDDPDRRRRDRSRDHRDSHRHQRDRDRHDDRHRDRERGEKSHRSRDERDSRRRSRDRYDRRDRR